MNSVQVAFWEWLCGVAQVIPTTARSTDSYSRVSLPADSFAICAAGAVILTPQGAPDQSWQAFVCEQIERVPSASLEDSLIDIANKYQHSLDRIREYERTVFYRVRSATRDQAILAQIRDELKNSLPAGWHAQLTNHDVSVVRDGCHKRHAIDWLLRNRIEQTPFTIGVGDSLADVEFLSRCDFIMGPQDCQWLQQLTAPDAEAPS